MSNTNGFESESDVRMKQRLDSICSRCTPEDSEFLQKMYSSGRELIERDGLTGVYNRRKFNLDTEVALYKAIRNDLPSYIDTWRY